MNQNTKHTPGILASAHTMLMRYANVFEIHRKRPLTEIEAEDLLNIERRIIACLNNLHGVSTEDLESGAFKKEIARTLEERGKLLAARTKGLDGWQLVPKKPTPEMVFQGRVLLSAYPEGRGTWLPEPDVIECWRNMLAAAPAAQGDADIVSAAIERDRILRAKSTMASDDYFDALGLAEQRLDAAIAKGKPQ